MLLVRLRGLSQSAAPVLLRGEPGAGKRLIGQVLHRMSARAAGPLIVVRPESLDPEQLRCTLWGCHPDQKKAEQPGAVVRASGGSLLITEVERLSAADRWLLARLITRGLYRPVGATQERAVRVRLVAATRDGAPASIPARPARRRSSPIRPASNPPPDCRPTRRRWRRSRRPRRPR